MAGDYTHNRMVICEGPEESAFVDALALSRGMPPFHSSIIGEPTKTGPGIDGLGHHLRWLVGVRGFRQTIKHIILLTDCDGDEAETLERIGNHIKNANTHPDVNDLYPIPKKPFVRVAGSISITVILQPGPGGTGCLETLLWSYLTRKYPRETGCVEGMLACSGVDKPAPKWSASKIDKAKVRAAIAVLNKENPARALTQLWKHDPDLIPLSEPEFEAIHGHLSAV